MASLAVSGAAPGLRGVPFTLALIAVAVVIFAFGRWLDSSYAFFIGYVVVQYIVLGTAWNILGGYTGYVNFGVTAFFAIGAYSTVVWHKLMPAMPLPVMILIGGVLAGLVVCWGVVFNERVIKVDDPCGAISVHGYCGWFGAVSVGIFADGAYGSGWNGVGPATYLGVAGKGVTGLLHGDMSQFVVQLGGATLCAVYAFVFTYVVFKLVNAVVPMRVSKEAELEGLDVPEFGMLAYPEEEGIPAV